MARWREKGALDEPAIHFHNDGAGAITGESDLNVAPSIESQGNREGQVLRFVWLYVNNLCAVVAAVASHAEAVPAFRYCATARPGRRLSRQRRPERGGTDYACTRLRAVLGHGICSLVTLVAAFDGLGTVI